MCSAGIPRNLVLSHIHSLNETLVLQAQNPSRRCPLGLDRIHELSSTDHDLIQKDRESSERYVFSQHCQRVWEKLSGEERDLIRRDVMSQVDAPLSSRFVDFDCLKELGRMIREAKGFPAVTVEQTVS